MSRTIPTAIAVFILLGLVAPAEAATFVVDGNRRLGGDAIKAFFKADAQGHLTDADLDAALKAMYRSGEFSDVKVSRSGDTIHVHVSENPMIGNVVFEGNKKLDSKKLEEIVQSKKDHPLWRAEVQDDVQRLLETYRQRGRFDAEVTPKTIAASGGRLTLVFEIREGQRIGVGEIGFTGNTAFPARDLKDVVSTGETNLLSGLLDNDLYDPDKVQTDREKLQHFYRMRGYADMSVTAAQPVYDAARQRFVLTFAIDEGRRYRLGAVTIDAAANGVDTTRLRPLLTTKGGDLYNAEAIEQTADAMSNALAASGHPFDAAEAKLQRVAGEDRIDLVYRVAEGPRLYVERIEIHGNTRTQEQVIRRELTLNEGDAYNRVLARTSEARLKRLGIFKTVKLGQHAGSSTDRVVVDVTVEDQNTGNVFVSGGYSDHDGWLAEISVSDNNLLGTGMSGKVSLSYGEYSRGFDIAFTQPYLFGQRISLGSNLFAKQSESSSYQSYNSMVYGGGVTLGAPLTNDVSTALRYSLANQTVTLDPSRGVSSLPVQDAAAAGPQWVSTIGNSMTYDTRNNVQDPTRGIRFTVNNDIAGLGGDVKFLRNTDDFRAYHELPGGIVGMVHAQGGVITPWGGQSLPLLNNFFGGPQLVRGFATNGFGPRDLTPGTAHDNIGGNAYWATSYELQAPVPFLPQSFGLKAAVFADAASLWGTGSGRSSMALSNSLVGNSRTVRSSIGAGLVWNSILGPLRVDYAYPLGKADYDVTQRLHFGYGLF